MSKQTQLRSTESQHRKNDHGYFDFPNFIKPYGFDGVDDPFIDRIMMDEAVLQLFNPDEYAAMREMVRPATAAEDEEQEEEHGKDEGNQVHHTTYSNQHQSKERNPERSRRLPNLSVDRWKLSPDYNQVSKQHFKKLLCQANPLYRQRLRLHLSNPKLLSFVQKRAHLMSTRFQLEMEKNYWKHVVDGLLPAVKWLSRMPKTLTRRYSINWDYPRTEHNIRHRQRLTEHKMKQIDGQIHAHSQKHVICWTISDKTLVDQNVRIISAALKVMICDDLESLHVRFEQKKTLIQYDAYDIHLLKSFYDLHPAEVQKVNAEKIWRAKRKSCQRILHQIKTNPLHEEQATAQSDTSSMFIGNNRLYSDYDYQHDQVSVLKPLSTVMRTIIEIRQTNMEKRTEQIIAFQSKSSTQ